MSDGKVSFAVKSHANSGRLSAETELPGQPVPRSLVVRFRHPDGKTMRTATVNGETWKDFDRAKEWVKVINPSLRHYTIVATY